VERDTEQYLSQGENEISLAEYTSRIREIHHRVKNNLQVIISLFGLQANRTADPRMLDIIRTMENRVRAIAYLHDPLYATDTFSTIHFGEYLNMFVRELHADFSLGSRVQLELSLADLALSLDEAVPLAQICNELLSNAFQHAFPENRFGKVSVALRYPNGTDTYESQCCELEVADSGVGLPQGTEVMTAESLGFHIVRLLTEQLQATIEVHSGKQGTSFLIALPLA
jgi:two-component sensor histidine kinase